MTRVIYSQCVTIKGRQARLGFLLTYRTAKPVRLRPACSKGRNENTPSYVTQLRYTFSSQRSSCFSTLMFELCTTSLISTRTLYCIVT